MSAFDPNAFLDTTVEGANDTVLVPPPAGEFLLIAEKIEAKAWSKKDDPSVGGLKLIVHWNIEDAGVKQTLGRDKITVKQDIMLDLVDGTNNLDMGKGKNVGLGRLREAIGRNTPGQPFSYSMIPGSMVKGTIKHRPDPKNADVIYAEVAAVAKP
ncbi:MAG: hypothetical protein INF12_18625 [Methylobacterium sp.]|nr:hypothetical protein [Methylobacterium sp.]